MTREQIAEGRRLNDAYYNAVGDDCNQWDAWKVWYTDHADALLAAAERALELEAALASIRKYLYDHEDVEDGTAPGRVIPNWAMRMVQDCAQEFKALKGGVA